MANELDENSRETYRVNHPTTKFTSKNNNTRSPAAPTLRRALRKGVADNRASARERHDRKVRVRDVEENVFGGPEFDPRRRRADVIGDDYICGADVCRARERTIGKVCPPSVESRILTEVASGFRVQFFIYLFLIQPGQLFLIGHLLHDKAHKWHRPPFPTKSPGIRLQLRSTNAISKTN